jgi:RHS repeat-associated protein
MTDGNGTIHARYSYDPYGRPAKVSGDMEADFGFAGYYHHAPSGLYLTLYRAYDPDTGRWLSRDPIGEDGGLNLYGYVANSPINCIDPLGLKLIVDPSASAAFRQEIQDALNYLINNSNFGLDLVNEAIANEHTIIITPDKDGAETLGSVVDRWQPKATIGWCPGTKIGDNRHDIRKGLKKYPKEVPPLNTQGAAVTLAHELGHALYDYNEPQNVPQVENRVRADFGLDPRETYLGKPLVLP